jgi:hypothetical protein
VADDLDQIVLLRGEAYVEAFAGQRLDVRRARAMLDRGESQVARPAS